MLIEKENYYINKILDITNIMGSVDEKLLHKEYVCENCKNVIKIPLISSRQDAEKINNFIKYFEDTINIIFTKYPELKKNIDEIVLDRVLDLYKKYNNGECPF